MTLSWNQMNNLLQHFDNKMAEFLQTLVIPAPQIRESIAYVLFSGGKRLRPQLVYLTGALLHVPLPVLDPIALAIELTHTYSLVHDDLPAMDNDDLRRGRPTCHIAFTEACAILTGDALQSIAITALIDGCPAQVAAETRLNMIKQLLEASGPAGMISGQDLDLTVLPGATPLNEAQLQTIHHLKTTALIQACIRLVLCNVTSDRSFHEQNLLNFTHHFGLAYQMQDDYLDKYAAASIGKAHASDEANQKQTFTSLYPRDELERLIRGTFKKATDSLVSYGADAGPLVEFVNNLNRMPTLSF
jgi:farnesyl diphosphate synthase